MKRLVIIRHGKSSWNYSNVSDADRPLKESGISNTIAMAGKLKAQFIHPDLLLSSPANRAMHTASIIARELDFPEEHIQIKPDIYSESEPAVLRIIQQADESSTTVFVVGHNPTFTFLANKFLKHPIANLPTSGMIILEFGCESWKNISPHNVIREQCLFPKKIDSDD